jgi:hypothetical protein
MILGKIISRSMSWIKNFFNSNFKFYFASFSIIIVFTFLVVEIVLRSMYFSSGVGLGGANQRWIEKYWTPINILGYRDYEILMNDSRPSIIFLGDSATAGDGVKFEETFYYSVRQSLDENYRAINLSRGGVSTTQEKHNFLELISKMNPNIDTLVFQIHGNDVDDYVELPKLNRNLLRRGLSRVSHLFAFFEQYYLHQTWVPRYMDTLYSGHQDQNVMTKHLIDINDITSTARKEDSKVIFLAIPFLSDMNSLERSEIYISKLKENFINTCTDNDYYIDITPIARNFNDSERVVSSVDHHASPELNFEIGLLLKRVLNDDYKEPNEGVTPCNF